MENTNWQDTGIRIDASMLLSLYNEKNGNISKELRIKIDKLYIFSQMKAIEAVRNYYFINFNYLLLLAAFLIVIVVDFNFPNILKIGIYILILGASVGMILYQRSIKHLIEDGEIATNAAKHMMFNPFENTKELPNLITDIEEGARSLCDTDFSKQDVFPLHFLALGYVKEKMGNAKRIRFEEIKKNNDVDVDTIDSKNVQNYLKSTLSEYKILIEN